MQKCCKKRGLLDEKCEYSWIYVKWFSLQSIKIRICWKAKRRCYPVTFLVELNKIWDSESPNRSATRQRREIPLLEGLSVDNITSYLADRGLGNRAIIYEVNYLWNELKAHEVSSYVDWLTVSTKFHGSGESTRPVVNYLKDIRPAIGQPYTTTPRFTKINISPSHRCHWPSLKQPNPAIILQISVELCCLTKNQQNGVILYYKRQKKTP